MLTFTVNSKTLIVFCLLAVGLEQFFLLVGAGCPDTIQLAFISQRDYVMNNRSNCDELDESDFRKRIANHMQEQYPGSEISVARMDYHSQYDPGECLKVIVPITPLSENPNIDSPPNRMECNGTHEAKMEYDAVHWALSASSVLGFKYPAGPQDARIIVTIHASKPDIAAPGEGWNTTTVECAINHHTDLVTLTHDFDRNQNAFWVELYWEDTSDATTAFADPYVIGRYDLYNSKNSTFVDADVSYVYQKTKRFLDGMCNNDEYYVSGIRPEKKEL